MRLAAALIVMTAAMGSSAGACTSIEVESPRIERGEGCSVSYHSPELSVSAQPARRLTDRFVRQFITVGSCVGEEIVVYYDCQDQKGVWLGGEFELMGLFSPVPHSGPGLAETSSGPADYFVRHEEPMPGPGLTIEALAEKARTLPWIAQSGRLNQSRITVEGKPFDLSCGCKLPISR
ncbi:hypothetical protein [Paracoccus methylarcula]|uniref:hypothetical protein n=1 Tax=Paracoccus methylarcula TaxID=72022 RepID=UPI0011CE47EB|nr:hypothetical protein [Paracoccus methylarcula]